MDLSWLLFWHYTESNKNKQDPYQFLTSFVGYNNGLIINKTERKSEALRKGEEYWITINETSHKEDDTIYLNEIYGNVQ